MKGQNQSIWLNLLVTVSLIIGKTDLLTGSMFLTCTKGHMQISRDRACESLGWAVPGKCWEEPTEKSTENPIPSFLTAGHTLFTTSPCPLATSSLSRYCNRLESCHRPCQWLAGTCQMLEWQVTSILLYSQFSKLHISLVFIDWASEWVNGWRKAQFPQADCHCVDIPPPACQWAALSWGQAPIHYDCSAKEL